MEPKNDFGANINSRLLLCAAWLIIHDELALAGDDAISKMDVLLLVVVALSSAREKISMLMRGFWKTSFSYMLPRNTAF